MQSPPRRQAGNVKEPSFMAKNCTSDFLNVSSNFHLLATWIRAAPN